MWAATSSIGEGYWRSAATAVTRARTACTRDCRHARGGGGEKGVRAPARVRKSGPVGPRWSLSPST